MNNESYDNDWVKTRKNYKEFVRHSNNMVHLEKNDIENYDEEYDKIASKTIYSLHFEQIQNNHGKFVEGLNLFKKGIDVNFSCPFYVEIERVPKYEELDFYSYVLTSFKISFPTCFLT